MQSLHLTRAFVIPITHGSLAIICFVSSSDRIPWDGLKQGLNFLGMVMYTGMILTASTGMTYYRYPLAAGEKDTL